MIDILRLAASGMRIPQIAKQLDCTQREAVDHLLAAVREAADQALDHDGSKEVELTHLDMLRSALTPLALRGDIGAARLLVRIHTARSLLLGLIEQPALDDLEPPEGVTELAKIRRSREERRGASSHRAGS
jgi:hypothetical protein